MYKIDIKHGSYEWHKLRQGKITGTSLKSALGSAKVQETLCYKIISEKMTETQIIEINSAAVIRGSELELFAKNKIIKETEIPFVETGVLGSKDYSDFIISPDAIYEKEGVVVGGLEIKCPDSKKHVEYLMKGELPKEYYHQILAPFLLSDDVQWWIFASYDDRNYEKPLSMLKLTRNYFIDIANHRKKLKCYIKDVNAKYEKLTF